MRRVCVIGAGAAGIAAAKHSLRQGFKVCVYEQYHEIGGTWVFSEETNIHSAMYEVMKTNLPKEMMCFQNEEFPSDLPSFMKHQDVLQYLKQQSKGLPIQLETKVVDVKRNEEKWLITLNHKNSFSVEQFDVVFVANGHHFEPFIPFDTSKFRGRILHSHDYRKPQEFADQKVAVVGAGPSGIDIALQVAEEAKQVCLLGRKAVYTGLPTSISQYPVNLKELGEHFAVLQDETVLHGIDAVIICTGYQLKFPFLSSEVIQLKGRNQMVSPLWHHVVHAEYSTSLFFIGLNMVAVTFTLFEEQVKLALALICGRAKAPSKQEMIRWENERIKSLRSRGMDENSCHFLGDEQWVYIEQLAEAGNFPKWEFHSVMKRMYHEILARKKTSITSYKNMNFILNDTKDDYIIEE